MTLPFLVLEHVSKIYPGGVQALRDVSLSVERDECVVLLGPSGCGKTTMLRLIAGLETVTSGEIYLSGKNVQPTPPWKREVNYMFQRPILLPHRTVRQNLEMRPSEPASAEISEAFGISQLMNRNVMGLSGGERQRVALVRSLLRQAPLSLLDEPLAHLDVPVKRRLWQELALLRRRLPATMLYVTHDPAEALAVADRIAVVLDGVIQQVDRPVALQARPAHRFVAEVLQDPDDPLNFLDREHVDRGWHLDWPNGDALAAIPASQLLASPCSSASAQLPWVATLTHWGPGQRLTVFERVGLRVLARATDDFDTGQTVLLHRTGQVVHWFHRTTGQRIEVG